MRGVLLLLPPREAQELRFLNPPSSRRPRLHPGGGCRLDTGSSTSPAGPLDSTGALRGGSDFRSQAKQVFENCVRAAAVGADFDDVVKLNFYVLDVRNLAALREVRDRYVNAAHPPARSCR